LKFENDAQIKNALVKVALEKLKYYEDLDNKGLVTHLEKPEGYLSVREMIYILQPDTELLDMGLKTVTDIDTGLEKGDQYRKSNINNYRLHYLQLCKIMTSKYKKQYGRKPIRLHKKQKDNTDVYFLNKPTTANVYPPGMIDIVKEYLAEKPLSIWENEFKKKQ
jgi:hypothetical protein